MELTADATCFRTYWAQHPSYGIRDSPDPPKRQYRETDRADAAKCFPLLPGKQSHQCEMAFE